MELDLLLQNTNDLEEANKQAEDTKSRRMKKVTTLVLDQSQHGKSGLLSSKTQGNFKLNQNAESTIHQDHENEISRELSPNEMIEIPNDLHGVPDLKSVPATPFEVIEQELEYNPEGAGDANTMVAQKA